MEFPMQQAPKNAAEQIQSFHGGLVSKMQELQASVTDSNAQQALDQLNPALQAFTKIAGEIQVALAQVASMATAVSATAAATNEKPKPPTSDDGAKKEEVAPTPLVVDQAKSACPAAGAGAVPAQTTEPKTAGTGATASPEKQEAPKPKQEAPKKPSEQFSLEALLEQALAGEQEDGVKSSGAGGAT